MKTNYSDRWPVAYRSQDEAGIPEGPFAERSAPRGLFFWGLLIGLLIVGPALIDAVESLS